MPEPEAATPPQVGLPLAAVQITTALPKTVQGALINGEVDSLTISNHDVTMNFSRAAIKQMNEQTQGGEIIITAAKADTSKLTGNAQTLIGGRPMYDFTVTCEGRIITDLGSNAVTTIIPYVLGAGETAADVRAVHVDANGVPAIIAGSYYDVNKQAVVFTTSQFSSGYGVGCRQAADYMVKKGDTLAGLARTYQTTIQARTCHIGKVFTKYAGNGNHEAFSLIGGSARSSAA